MIRILFADSFSNLTALRELSVTGHFQVIADSLRFKKSLSYIKVSEMSKYYDMPWIK